MSVARILPAQLAHRIPARLGVFLVLGLTLLSLQYPLGLLQLNAGWDMAIYALLVHCVVMLVDAICATCWGHDRKCATGKLAYFIPVEGRGLPQLITLVACIAAMAAATKLHELGSSAASCQQ